MVEKDEIINNEEKTAEIFNTFFTNIASKLKTTPYQGAGSAGGIDPVVGDYPIAFILEKYKNRASILASFVLKTTFNFKTLKSDDFWKKQNPHAYLKLLKLMFQLKL